MFLAEAMHRTFTNVLSSGSISTNTNGALYPFWLLLKQRFELKLQFQRKNSFWLDYLQVREVFTVEVTSFSVFQVIFRMVFNSLHVVQIN